MITSYSHSVDAIETSISASTSVGISGAFVITEIVRKPRLLGSLVYISKFRFPKEVKNAGRGVLTSVFGSFC